MRSELLTSGIWRWITASVKKQPTRCAIAVAYFGKGASELLPLKRGSTLVVDMSPGAVGSGQTHPQDILKLVNKGVDVYSVDNLHAKVFSIGKRAFVGSTNASYHSANGLVEACVATDSRPIIASCRKLVESLRGEAITPGHAKRMQRFWNPPKFGSPGGPRSERKRVTPRHSPLWVVPLVLGGWNEKDYEQEKHGLPKAKKKLRSPRRFVVEDFRWTEDDFLKRLKQGDLLIQALKENDNRVMISPAGRVLYIRRYPTGRRSRAIIYVESAKGERRKNLKTLIEQVGPQVKRLCSGVAAKPVSDWSLAHALLNAWPSANSQ